MTQASLSPDLPGALGAVPANPAADVRPGPISEAALWLVALLSSGLVLAAVLLLGLLARNAIADASFGGFVSGIAVMVAALGVGGQAYALVTAKRQGLLGPAPDAAAPTASAAVPDGMHVVPARSADPSRRRREELQAARAERSKQATAIAAAVAASTEPRPTQRPPATPPATPRQNVSAPPPVPTAQPVPARPAPPRQAQADRPMARTQSIPRLAIRMPGPPVRAPRPAAWPMAAPVVRMAGPRVHPHSQAALFQVAAANERPSVPSYRR